MVLSPQISGKRELTKKIWLGRFLTIKNRLREKLVTHKLV